MCLAKRLRGNAACWGMVVFVLIVVGLGGTLMKKRNNKNSKTGRFAMKSQAAGQKSKAADKKPVTARRIADGLRYLNEDAFRPRTKK